MMDRNNACISQPSGAVVPNIFREYGYTTLSKVAVASHSLSHMSYQ